MGPRTSNNLNISWDLLPCHLQNGADITGYIIQYGPTFGGEAQNVSRSDSQAYCGVESGGPYKCLFSDSVLDTTTGVSYTFQVAAVNRYGAGPFSDPVIGVSSGRYNYIIIYNNVITSVLLLSLKISFPEKICNGVYNESNETITEDPSQLTPKNEDITSREIRTSELQNTFTTLRPSSMDEDSASPQGIQFMKLKQKFNIFGTLNFR